MKRNYLLIGIVLLFVIVAAFFILGTNSASKPQWFVVNEAKIYPENSTIGDRTLVSVEFNCENKYFQVVIAGTTPSIRQLGCDQKVTNLKVNVYDLLQGQFTAEQRLKLLEQAEIDLNFDRLGQFPGQRVYGTVGITSSAWPVIVLK